MINTVLNFNLSDYGNWSSIIGLTISLFTFGLVITLRNQCLFRSRIDEHCLGLEDIASNVSELLISFQDNTLDIDKEFAIANVKLRAIQKGSSKELLSDIKKTRRRIKKFRFCCWTKIPYFQPKEKSARQIYTDLNIVIEELGNVKKELLIGK